MAYHGNLVTFSAAAKEKTAETPALPAKAAIGMELIPITLSSVILFLVFLPCRQLLTGRVCAHFSYSFQLHCGRNAEPVRFSIDSPLFG
jgi:hypothetical protein